MRKLYEGKTKEIVLWIFPTVIINKVFKDSLMIRTEISKVRILSKEFFLRRREDFIYGRTYRGFQW